MAEPVFETCVSEKVSVLDIKAVQYIKQGGKSISCLWPLDAVLSSGLYGKEGGPTSCDKLNRSENYLLLGFLLAMPSQTVLLLVRKSAT